MRVHLLAHHPPAINGAPQVTAVGFASVIFFAQLGPLAFNDGALLLFGTLSIGWTLLAMRQPSEATAERPAIEARTDVHSRSAHFVP